MRGTLVLLLSFIVLNSIAQEYSTKNKKAISNFEKGLKQFEYKKDNEAIAYLEKAKTYDKSFYEPYLLLIDVYMERKQFEQSIKECEGALSILGDALLKVYYKLGEAELKASRYDDAIVHLTKYLNNGRPSKYLRPEAEKMLRNAQFASYAVKNPVPFAPVNLGESVNSEEDEFHPSISPDEQTLIITRKLPEGKSGGFMHYTEDFFYTIKDKQGNWRPLLNMGPPLNTDGNEGAQSISPDGQRLFFTACDRKDGYGSCDLYTTYRKGNQWANPKNLDAPVNSKKWDSQPSLSTDGKTLYFSSSRPGGKGRADIYYCVARQDGSWGRPFNLPFNTDGDEMAPFIHPDGKTLYFSSTGLPGMGGFDLYVVKKDENGQWGEPLNLGYPINTQEDEHGVIVGGSGEIAYFASNREGGLGKLDIYAFELHKDARPNRVTYAKGVVFNAKTKDKLGADFDLIDLATNEVVVHSKSNTQSGEFLVCLPTNRDYALNVSKQGFLFYSENFSLTEQGSASEPTLLNVPLHPIEKNGIVVLKNIFFETAKYDLKPTSEVELKKLIAFLNTNPNLKIEISGHTDNVGAKGANQVLSENRAKAVYEFLINASINAERLSFAGYGDLQPIATNETPEGRQQNRRTQFKVIGNE